MHTKLFLAAALAAAFVPGSQATEFVYQNASGDMNLRLGAGTDEIGDEIILAGSERVLSSFDFQYYCISLNNNEQARIRFYTNDGTEYLNQPDARRPLSMFYDSGYFDIAATPRQRVVLTAGSQWMPNPITLPERFTWSIQFSNVDPGEDVGVDIYNGLTVGNNYNDFWFNNGGTWELRSNAVTTAEMNFGAQFVAVPEPSTWSLLLAGAGMGLCLLKRKGRADRR